MGARGCTAHPSIAGACNTLRRCAPRPSRIGGDTRAPQSIRCSRMRSMACESLLRGASRTSEGRALCPTGLREAAITEEGQRASRRHGRRIAKLQLFGPRATPPGADTEAARSSSSLTLMAQSTNEGAVGSTAETIVYVVYKESTRTTEWVATRGARGYSQR